MSHESLVGILKMVAWLYLILSFLGSLTILSFFRELVIENTFGIALSFGVLLQGVAIWGLFSAFAAIIDVLLDIRDGLGE